VYKSIVMMDVHSDDIAAMERWYYRDHSSEIARRYGPWLARHESYVALPAPPEAKDYGYYSFRVTETYWHEAPLGGPRGAYCFTPAPAWDKVAVVGNVPPQPTEDFFGWDCLPAERACIRWYIMFRYPLGVRPEEGEDWFLNVHAPEVMKQPGLRRFFSTKVNPEAKPLAGTWSPHIPMHTDPPMVQFDRTMELWYDSPSAWKNAVIDNPPAYTKPEWSVDPWYPNTVDTYPFLKPGADFVSTFLLERPADEFLRDVRHYAP
jgi:hypothetical protein